MWKFKNFSAIQTFCDTDFGNWHAYSCKSGQFLHFKMPRILTSVNLCNFSWSKFSIVKIQGLWKCQNGSFEQNIFKIPYCVLSWTFQVWIWSGFRKHYRDEGYYLWYTTSLRGAVKISRELDWMDRMWWQDWGSAHYLWPKSIKYGRKGGNNSHC